jgi:biofilm PGA synthesis protein PgaA
LSAGSTDPALVPDLVTLLQQAGHSAEAVAVWEMAHPASPPGYALAAMVRAYRDQRQSERAEMLARDGLRRFPADPLWPVLLGLVLADAGRGDEALAVLAAPAAARAPILERLLAQAYAARRANRPFDSLRYYADAMRRDPASAEARRGMQETLLAIRAPWGAAAVAAPPAPAEQMLRKQPAPLAADLAAAEIRWGEVDRPYDRTRRFDGTDRALADIDRLLAANPDGAVATQLRLDRIIALRDRVRMDEAVAEADRLSAAGVALPPYVRHAMADALLYLRRPGEALAGYDVALAADPADVDAAVGRIYSLAEMEEFSKAYEAADALVARQPIWQRYIEDPSLYAHSEWLDALLLAGLIRYYGDQPAEAWARIEPERNAAPANVEVRLAAGSIMSGRDWPRAGKPHRSQHRPVARWRTDRRGGIGTRAPSVRRGPHAHCGACLGLS